MASSSPKTILLIAANTDDAQNLALPREFRDIEEGVRLANKGDNYVIETVGATRYKDLRRKLLQYHPHIVHFSGHGSKSGLFLADDHGKAQKASVQRLVNLLSKFKESIECVILNACDSDVIAEGISHHIPYAIGMNAPINDPAAIEFSTGFYDALASGRNYQDAFDFGVNAISDAALTSHRSFEISNEHDTDGGAGESTKPIIFTNPTLKKHATIKQEQMDISIPHQTTEQPLKQKKSNRLVYALVGFAGVAALVLFNIFQSSEKPPPINGLLGKPVSNKQDFALCQKGSDAQQSIIRAAGKGKTERVQHCISLGVDVNTKDHNQWTPLHAAAFNGELETARFLVSKKADINAQEKSKRTPLFLAVQQNHHHMVEYLVNLNADKNIADSKGNLPISVAKSDQMRSKLQ